MVTAEQFRELARALTEPTLLVAFDGRILAVNQAGQRSLAFVSPSLEGKSLLELAADSRATLPGYLRICSRTRTISVGAIAFPREGGAVAEFRLYGALVAPRSEDDAGAILLRLMPKADSVSSFVLLNRKIDDLLREVGRRKAVEEALRESKERLQVVLRSIGDAVITTDTEGRVSFLNAVAQDLCGWTEEQARGRPLAEVFVIVNEDTGAPVESPVDRVLREGNIVGLANHTELIARDGTHLPIDDSAAPIRAPGGELHGVVLVFREIRQRKEAERQREDLLQKHAAARVAAEQARREAERANRAKDQFLSTLSHELRTPLNAILGWLNILNTSPPNADRLARALTVIERNAAAQAHLIEDILDVSRIITGKLQLNVGVVDLHAVLRASVDVVRPAADAKGVSVDAQLDPGAVAVQGDADRLQQVAWNLLSNAVKFTPKGGRVEVTLARAAEHVVLRVADTGDGIGADFLPHVFERFRQADASSTRAHGGLGLGLAIVKHIIELHGGTITAASDGPGLGTLFTVTLAASP